MTSLVYFQDFSKVVIQIVLLYCDESTGEVFDLTRGVVLPETRSSVTLKTL